MAGKVEKTLDLFSLFKPEQVADVKVDKDSADLLSATVKVSDEVINFVRQGFAPWLAVAVELAHEGRSDRFVRINRAVPHITRINDVDSKGKQKVDKDGKAKVLETTADELASQLQSALRQSMTDDERRIVPKVYKRDGDGHKVGEQAKDSNGRPLFLVPNWQVRTTKAKATDIGWNPDVDQDVFMVRITLSVIDNDEKGLALINEALARQNDRADAATKSARAKVVAGGKASNTGKAAGARKAS